MPGILNVASMILMLGSFRWSASQSVETSGSSVVVMGAGLRRFRLLVIAGLDPAILFFEVMDTRVKPACDNLQPFFFGSHFSTGPPASRQAAKPPAMWATGFRPMSLAVLAASAERMPPAQWKMNFLSSWKTGLA